MIKDEIRILGIDDGYFEKGKDSYDIIVGVIFRGYKQIDGVLSEKIEVDGDDCTDKIINMVKKTKHYYQIRVIMTNGITFAGFNILDVEKLYDELKIPIIIVIRKKPNIEKFKEAMKYVKNYEYKLKIFNKIGEIKSVQTRFGTLYYQNYGINDEMTKEILIKTSVHSRIPEPVRIAHMIAMGVTRGYSRGKP